MRRNLSTLDYSPAVDYHFILYHKTDYAGYWNASSEKLTGGRWIKICRVYGNNQGGVQAVFRIVGQEYMASGSSNICNFVGEYELFTCMDRSGEKLSYSWSCKNFDVFTTPMDENFREDDVICICSKNINSDFDKAAGVYYDIYFNANGKSTGFLRVEELFRPNQYAKSDDRCSSWTYWYSNKCKDENGKPVTAEDSNSKYKQVSENSNGLDLTRYNLPPTRADWENCSKVNSGKDLQPNREFFAKSAILYKSDGTSQYYNFHEAERNSVVKVNSVDHYFMPLTRKPGSGGGGISAESVVVKCWDENSTETKEFNFLIDSNNG